MSKRVVSILPDDVVRVLDAEAKKNYKNRTDIIKDAIHEKYDIKKLIKDLTNEDLLGE